MLMYTKLQGGKFQLTDPILTASVIVLAFFSLFLSECDECLHFMVLHPYEIVSLFIFYFTGCIHKC